MVNWAVTSLFVVLVLCFEAEPHVARLDSAGYIADDPGFLNLLPYFRSAGITSVPDRTRFIDSAYSPRYANEKTEVQEVT